MIFSDIKKNVKHFHCLICNKQDPLTLHHECSPPLTLQQQSSSSPTLQQTNSSLTMPQTNSSLTLQQADRMSKISCYLLSYFSREVEKHENNFSMFFSVLFQVHVSKLKGIRWVRKVVPLILCLNHAMPSEQGESAREKEEEREREKERENWKEKVMKMIASSLLELLQQTYIFRTLPYFFGIIIYYYYSYYYYYYYYIIIYYYYSYYYYYYYYIIIYLK